MALDERAFLEVYRRLEVPLYNVLYRMLWNAAECQDVAHDAYLRVWARRTQVRDEGVEALVYATALNLASNRLRWQRLRQWTGLEATEAAETDAPAAAAEQAGLRAAMARMPRAAREVLLLSEFAGLSGEEIARLVGIPAGTVASRKHAALRWLRERMEQDDA